MNEWVMILTMLLGGGLWAAGGTHIPNIGGQKWLRRYLLPVILAVIAALHGGTWWTALAFCILSIGAYSMGYGETKPYWYKLLVGVGWMLPMLFFGLSWWMVITPVLWIIMFRLSNYRRTAHTFKWKTVEFIVGVLIGITFINTLQGM